MNRTAVACAILLAVVLPACDDNETPGGPSTPAPTTAPPFGPPTPPTPPVSAGNQPPALVFRLRPDSPVGPVPLEVIANMCGSSDPEGVPLIFEYKWGGMPRPHFSYFCRDDHVYTVPGTFHAFFCVNDDHDNRVCENVLITVTP